MRGGITHTRIDEYPAIRGARSLLRQDVPIKLPRNTCSSGLGENGSNNDGAAALCHAMESCQQIGFLKYILSTVLCGICFAEPDTILVFKIFYGVFIEGTRLAMPKTICTPGLIVIEARFRGY